MKDYIFFRATSISFKVLVPGAFIVKVLLFPLLKASCVWLITKIAFHLGRTVICLKHELEEVEDCNIDPINRIDRCRSDHNSLEDNEDHQLISRQPIGWQIFNWMFDFF